MIIRHLLTGTILQVGVVGFRWVVGEPSTKTPVIDEAEPGAKMNVATTLG